MENNLPSETEIHRQSRVPCARCLRMKQLEICFSTIFNDPKADISNSEENSKEKKKKINSATPILFGNRPTLKDEGFYFPRR